MTDINEPTVSAADLGQETAPAEVALPWYKSHTVVGIIAAILLSVAQKAGFLGEVTQDQLIQLLIVVLPMIVALWGRITTTRPVVTLTASKARAINQTTN